MSPFGSGGKRQTSFAAVDVMPDIGEDINIDIDWEKDVREDKLRAQGAGGQHVNKTESAIRLTCTSRPGSAVLCQNERSQHQNRAQAKKMLTAKLFHREQVKAGCRAGGRGEERSRRSVSAGRPIRNYVLQPEQFVKDTRTDLKTDESDGSAGRQVGSVH